MNETTYKLDTEAIRKRFAEAVAIGYNGSEIGIFISCEHGALNLVTGHVFRLAEVKQFANWTIRPGDMAEFSDGGNWRKCRFEGFSGSHNKPFVGRDRTDPVYHWSSIRPLPQTSPEKVKVMEQVEKMERELAELKARAEELK